MALRFEDAVSFHQPLAEEWEKNYSRPSFAARLEVLDRCLSGIGLGATQWLDAGCGTGTLSRWLAKRGCQVNAVDASPEMLRVAAQFAQSSKVRGLAFQRIDTIERLPFANNSFDGIVCSSVIEYVRDPNACLKEFYRVLRPAGVLLVSVPSARSMVRVLSRLTHRCTTTFGKPWPKYLSVSKHQYSISEFRRLLHICAFETERVIAFATPFVPAWSTNQVIGRLLMFCARKRKCVPAEEIHNASGCSLNWTT